MKKLLLIVVMLIIPEISLGAWADSCRQIKGYTIVDTLASYTGNVKTLTSVTVDPLNGSISAIDPYIQQTNAKLYNMTLKTYYIAYNSGVPFWSYASSGQVWVNDATMGTILTGWEDVTAGLPAAECTPEPPCPAANTPTGSFYIPGKYPDPPYCINDCAIELNTVPNVISYSPESNSTYYNDAHYTGEECVDTQTPEEQEYMPESCDEVKNRCAAYCGLNNITMNECQIDGDGIIYSECICKEWPLPDYIKDKPAEAVQPVEDEPTQPTPPTADTVTPDPEAADPETTPDTDTDKWLKAVKHALEEGNAKQLANLKQVGDALNIQLNAQYEANLYGKNQADNQAVSAQNSAKIVNQLSDVKDAMSNIKGAINGVKDGVGDVETAVDSLNTSVEAGNEKLDEIKTALTDTTTGQSELAQIDANQYDGTLGTSDMPVEGDLQAILTTFYNFNPFRTVYENSTMNMNSANACLNFPNPLGGVSQQVCFDDFESTWNMMGLILVGLSGFMAFRIIKG